MMSQSFNENLPVRLVDLFRELLREYATLERFSRMIAYFKQNEIKFDDDYVRENIHAVNGNIITWFWEVDKIKKVS